jgi:hypothetical protein
MPGRHRRSTNSFIVPAPIRKTASRSASSIYSPTAPPPTPYESTSYVCSSLPSPMSCWRRCAASGLHGTVLANATCASLRLKLLKIGAQVRPPYSYCHGQQPLLPRCMAPGSGTPAPLLIPGVKLRPMNDRVTLQGAASPQQTYRTSVCPNIYPFAPYPGK